MDKLILPGDLFYPENFNIPFPVSLYNNGTVAIKKLKCGKINISAKCLFSDSTFTHTSYSVASSKENMLKEELSTLVDFEAGKDTLIYGPHKILFHLVQNKNESQFEFQILKQ